MNPRSGEPFDLIRDVLDHELIDAEGESCGMVDDIELAMRDGAPRVASLIVGPGAVRTRLTPLFAWAWMKIASARVTKVPWAEVESIAETIHLRSKASEVGLGRADRRSGRWLKRIPGA